MGQRTGPGIHNCCLLLPCGYVVLIPGKYSPKFLIFSPHFYYCIMTTKTLVHIFDEHEVVKVLFLITCQETSQSGKLTLFLINKIRSARQLEIIYCLYCRSKLLTLAYREKQQVDRKGNWILQSV